MNRRKPESLFSTAQIFDGVARGVFTAEEGAEMLRQAAREDSWARRPRWMPRWLWAVLEPVVNTVLR